MPWRLGKDRGGHGSDRKFTCLLTGRTVHLKSIAEKAYFHLWERMHGVFSVEECFPLLDIGQTLRLCGRFGIAHPVRAGYPEPFVLHFLIRELLPNGKTRLHARTLGSQSSTEPCGLDVVHEVCRANGIEWRLVDPTSLDQPFLASLRFAREGASNSVAEDTPLLQRFSATFLRAYSPSTTLETLLAQCAAAMRIHPGECLVLFRAAVWFGFLRINFVHALRLDRPVAMCRDAQVQ